MPEIWLDRCCVTITYRLENKWTPFLLMEMNNITIAKWIFKIILPLYYKNCKKITPHLQKDVNHILHLLVTLLTMGAWLIGWIILTVCVSQSDVQCTMYNVLNVVYGIIRNSSTSIMANKCRTFCWHRNWCWYCWMREYTVWLIRLLDV